MNTVKFDALDSYQHLGLILSSKTIGAPSPKYLSVDIPGADGELDYTEYFGRISYNNRQLSFNFSVIGDHKEFLNKYSTLQNLFNGRRMKITLSDDPDFYYIGRVSVNEWQSEKNIGKVVVEVNAEPYKLKHATTVIHQTISEETVICCYNLKKRVEPTITTTADVYIEYGRYSEELNDIIYEGVNTVIFKEGRNFLRIAPVKDAAEVTIKYQEGSL